MNEKALRVRYQKNKVKKERWKMYDVIIIGAGVSGAAAARELSRYNAKVCVIEKEEDVCCGTSKANSAIVHAGYDAKEGSLMAKLNVRGNALMEQLSKDLDFPFKRIGSLVVCKDEEDMPNLKALYDRGVVNGVPGLRILSKEEVHEMEPNLEDDICAALYAPSAGIVCPFNLNIALAENANVNGVEFKFDTEVTDLKKSGDIWEVHTNQGADQVTGEEYVLGKSDKNHGNTTDCGASSYYKLTASNICVSSICVKDSSKLAAQYKADTEEGVDKYKLVEDLAKLKSDTVLFRAGNASGFLKCMISDISIDTQQSTIFSNNYTNIQAALETQRMSVSGVDEDEEALDLIKFQNAYNLSSKMISVMAEVYDKLIEETGV